MADLEVFSVLSVGAVADEASAKDAVNKLMKGVSDALGKDGRIDLNTELNIDIKKAKKDVLEAQDAVVTQWEKMFSKKGFSASADDLDILTQKYNDLKTATTKVRLNNESTVKVITNTIGKVVELYTNYKKLIKIQQEASEIKNVSKSKKAKQSKPKTAEDRYLDKQEEYSKRAKESVEKKALKQELEEVRRNKSEVKSSGHIKTGTTNEHLMRLSEYSAHGSNWANELAGILKEEITKTAKTLVTYIDPSYKVKTNGGRTTTEQEFLTDTIKNVKNTLSSYIAQLEAGSEEITLDMLEESAAVIKVLTKAIGKTTEDAEKTIIQATQGRYDQKQSSPKGGGRLGGTDLEDNEQKGVGPGHEYTKQLITQLYDEMKAWNDEVTTEKIFKEINDGVSSVGAKISEATAKIAQIKNTDSFKTEMNKLNTSMTNVLSSEKDTVGAIEKQLSYDKIENTREAVADSNEQRTNKLNSDINRDVARAVKQDLTTGFNTDSKANELIGIVRNIFQQIQILTSNKKQNKDNDIEKSEATVEQENIQSIDGTTESVLDDTRKDYSMEIQKAWEAFDNSIDPLRAQMALVPVEGTVKNWGDGREHVKVQRRSKEIEEERKKQEDAERAKVQKSNIYASPYRQGVWSKFEDMIVRITGATSNYEKVLRTNAEEQDKLAAERIEKYGLNNGRNPNDTGDIAGMRRILQLYRTNKASIEQNPELMQKIKLTEGRDVDTTEITKALNNALSGRQMQNAQNGGGFLKNAFGFLTGGLGYAFMPSLEKSRAQADGLNQMYANINKSLQSVLINIQTKETELKGMQDSGQAVFDKDGFLTSDSSSAAFKTLADLEEEKLVLDSIKADLLANDEIIKKTGGRFGLMVKHLNFTSPVLKENNGLLRNLNSGLDKNGKALKFQNRMAEILNYTYQLMSRSIGQMLKQWISMLNPINWIKKAFNFFSSYDVKWQRTLNVIKYNLRDIIKPMMEWIAQKLVNMIGFVDIISQKIQAAFGRNPISLFDQENANQVKKDAEEIASISAGFDELHDIGTEGSDKDANNLLGEIYKPELSPEWQKLAEDIGDLFAGVIKGDLGFSEAMTEILRILGETLKLIGGIIWDFIKETIWPFIKDNWLEILGWILAAFMAWKGLSLLGTLLWKALFGLFTKSKIASVFSNVGQWILSSLGLNSLAQGISLGFSSLLAGGKYSLIGTIGEMFTNSAAITASQSWGSMIGFAFVKALAATVSIALGGKMLADAFDGAADNASYDAGLMASGGNEEDKKGIGVGNVLKGTAGGAAIGFGIGQIIPVVGPVVGAAIGAVVGALTTSLAPAFEKVEIAARNANNEMQKMEYYEGVVQGYSTEVQKLTELQQVLNDTLDLQKTKVYEEGEQLGITRTRMDELITSITNGTFSVDMLNGSEIALKDSLIQLNDQQIRTTEATEKLEAAKRKLQKAEIDLAIAEDVAAGNFELAAARIEYAEAAMLYTEEEATAKRVQLYKEAGEEEAKYLLQDLTPEQRKKMADINSLTQEELASFVGKWRNSSQEVKNAFLSGVDQDTQNKFEQQMNEIDGIIEEHQGFWQGVGDTLKEIFTFGIADTWTYNGETKASAEYKSKVAKMAVGTNYVPHDGLAYLHQGEAVIPKKYNQPYQPASMSPEERAYMTQMMSTMRSLDSTMKQGINVNGQFVQRGSDLVAVVNKTKSQTGADLLSNVSYAR